MNNGSDITYHSMTESASLITYWEIIRDLVSEFNSECPVWAEPFWLENCISVFVVVATVFYLYVVGVIICNFCKLRSPFYWCALSLAVGDLVLLISSIREGRVQSCVLKQDPTRQYAWQTIGTFGMDCTLTSNLVMALTRFAAVYTIPRQLTRLVAKLGIAISFIWTIAMTFASHFGLMSHIWFENGIYKDEMKFPFQYIRIGFLLVCIFGTFLVYCAMLVITLQIRASAKRADMMREMKMFAQCVFIFALELSFLYATFWFGFHYLHLGGPEANARVNYVVRPLATGLTPVIYVVFSTKMRSMMRKPFDRCDRRKTAKQPPNSSTCSCSTTCKSDGETAFTAIATTAATTNKIAP